MKRGPSSSCEPDWHPPAETELNPILHPASWLSGDSFADLVGSFCLGEGRYTLRDRHQESCFGSSFHDARLPLTGLLQTLLFVLICSIIKFKAFEHHPTSDWKRLNWFEKNFTVLLVRKEKSMPVLGTTTSCHTHSSMHLSWINKFPTKRSTTTKRKQAASCFKPMPSKLPWNTTD